MTEKEPEPVRTQPTRRSLMASNIKTIGAIAATVLVARLAGTTAAQARSPACFLRGTKIRTALGERSVEDLAVGDMLPTVFGGTRPIQWVARYRRTRSDTSKPWLKHVQPICIKSSALAAGVPHADLYVTPGHAMFIDGVLIPAGSLINGTTIAPYAAEEYDELEFFQIKLETHDVIYAEGAPCETLLRVDETANNFAEYFRTYGSPATQERHCAPIICNGAYKEIKSRIRSTMSPWRGPHKADVIRGRLEERAMSLSG
jgi:hypothetical protein